MTVVMAGQLIYIDVLVCSGPQGYNAIAAYSTIAELSPFSQHVSPDVNTEIQQRPMRN